MTDNFIKVTILTIILTIGFLMGRYYTLNERVEPKQQIVFPDENYQIGSRDTFYHDQESKTLIFKLKKE